MKIKVSICLQVINKVSYEEQREPNQRIGIRNTYNKKRLNQFERKIRKRKFQSCSPMEVKRNTRKRFAMNPSQAEEKQKKVSYLQPNEAQGKRKEKHTKMKFEDYIQLSRGDDKTLNKLNSQRKK